MDDRWFYAVGEERRGPVAKDDLLRLIQDGRITRSTLVWMRGLTDWIPAGEAAELSDAAWPATAAAVPSDTASRVPAVRPESRRSSVRDLLTGAARKLSVLAEFPSISRIPVREIFLGAFAKPARAGEMEEIFAVGTPTTTPPLSSVPSGWPAPRVFWRLLGGAVAAYVLLRIGLTAFTVVFAPALIAVGCFVFPLCFVIFFFEIDTPRNVSVYLTGKLVLLGGASSLVVALLLGRLPASGGGALVPAFLTAVIEEAAKTLVLLVVAGNPRYPWQSNGLLFGAAVGAGFAAFESSANAFNLSRALDAAAGATTLQGVLAPGGHLIWTAMVGSAIWKAKGNRPLEAGMLLSPIVVRRFTIAVILHGLWGTGINPPSLRWTLLAIIGWYFVLGFVAQSLDEVEAARKALSSPAP